VKGAEQLGRVGVVARVAQSVERTLGKGEVIGSIPIASLGVGHYNTDSN
jgi:hypothetical protein